MPDDRSPEPDGNRRQFELEYYSSREERLSRPDAPRIKAAQRGFFRRNIRLLIVFSNVVLLVVLVLLLKRPAGESGSEARLGPYMLMLQGLRFQDTVYATVTVKRSGGRDHIGQRSDGRIGVRFTLAGSQGGYLQAASLPQAPGEEVVVGEAIPIPPGAAEAQELRAEAAIAGRVRILRLKIKP